MELILYLSLVLLGMLSVLLNRKSLYFLYFALLILFLYVVRISGFDTDVAKYAKWMVWDFKGLVYYREFLYFFVSRGLYSLLDSEVLAFFTMDLLWCAVVLYSLTKIFDSIKDSFICFCVIITSFPAILGFENFHRQHMATAFALLAYSYSYSSILKSGVTGVSAILFHNSAILTVPTLLGKKFSNFSTGVRTVIIFLLITLLFLVLLVFSGGGAGELKKSNASTGLNLSALYIAVYFLMLVFSLIVTKGSFKKSFEMFTPAYVGFFLVILMALLFNDAPAERVGQLFLVLTIPAIIQGLKNISGPFYTLGCSLLLMTLSVPMLVFDNALQFLL